MLPETPRFWQENGILAKFLSPLSCLYLVGHRIKMLFSFPYFPNIPVVCVGGVTVGGSGKTPTLHSLLALIEEHGLYQNPVILTRGYGGSIKDATLVDPAIHNDIHVGDEALLHAAKAKTIVSANRAKGAKLAEKLGADIILMDDGLQNNGIKKNISFLVVDGKTGFGNGRLLPAGPLREPLQDALDKSIVVLQIGDGTLAVSKPVLKGHIVPLSHPDKSKSYVGFAGIGHPEKFHDTLKSMGLAIKAFVPFPDHMPYTPAHMEKLRGYANGNTLITTQKDYVRIPPDLRGGIETLDIRIDWEDPQSIVGLLKAAHT